MSRIRCIFMASDPIALPSMELLHGHFAETLELVALYTQPDRRSGRGKRLTANPVKNWAMDHGLSVLQPERMRAEVISEFHALQPELVVVMAYGHLLPQRMLGLARLGFVNLHASLLPRLRGASPIETAIATGETQTGVTLMRIVPELDAGPILDAESCEIFPDDTGSTLRQRLSGICVPLLRRGLPPLLDGTAIASAQNPAQATYCRMIDKDDGWLDFSLSTEALRCHIRSFQPWPGALFACDGVTYRIGDATAATLSSTARPGLLVRNRKQVRIATADGWLEVLQLQKPGGKMLPIQDFLNGCALPDQIQLRFPSRFPLVGPSPFRKPKGRDGEGKA